MFDHSRGICGCPFDIGHILDGADLSMQSPVSRVQDTTAALQMLGPRDLGWLRLAVSNSNNV
jgi:hypothetical protein